MKATKATSSGDSANSRKVRSIKLIITLARGKNGTIIGNDKLEVLVCAVKQKVKGGRTRYLGKEVNISTITGTCFYRFDLLCPLCSACNLDLIPGIQNTFLYITFQASRPSLDVMRHPAGGWYARVSFCRPKHQFLPEIRQSFVVNRLRTDVERCAGSVRVVGEEKFGDDSEDFRRDPLARFFWS